MSTDLGATTSVRVPRPVVRAEDPAGSDGAMVDVARVSDRGARIAAVAIALVWHLAIGLPALLGGWPELAAPTVVAAGWLAALAVGGWAGHRLLHGLLPPVVPLAAILLAVDAAVFAAAGERQLFAAGNWAWTGLAWFFVVVLWGRPIRWMIILLAGHSVIALAALIGDGATAPADLTRYAMYVYGTSSLPVAVFTGAAVIATLARQRADTAAATLAVRAERDAAERAWADRRARLALVGSAAEQVLAELADGRADPTDPFVQRRCVLAATRLRRLIAESDDVPDPLLHELRAAADLAERNGLPIELIAIGTPPPLPVEVRRRLADPLAAALADATGWARLTVVAGPDEVVISLVAPDVDGPGSTDPPATPVGNDDQVEHVLERDGEIRWTQTRWRQP
ncbi:hypothetical protein GA0070216_11479 [Micromonospora matsumotoense]|uniref:Signal transduction histidine kinase n=1 Tax=Micromonospora matsumotoense TaxID=121616 RepID=A0A1C5A6Z1_9ACTN|nr:hypothetical protein [Micromonospora matsumotoense]SCF40957.1 hypothetical protein GA0070216_11479 [Micromonospora matsumotoense]